jgi:hypothetical protein
LGAAYEFATGQRLASGDFEGGRPAPSRCSEILDSRSNREGEHRGVSTRFRVRVSAVRAWLLLRDLATCRDLPAMGQRIGGADRSHGSRAARPRRQGRKLRRPGRDRLPSWPRNPHLCAHAVRGAAESRLTSGSVWERVASRSQRLQRGVVRQRPSRVRPDLRGTLRLARPRLRVAPHGPPSREVHVFCR